MLTVSNLSKRFGDRVLFDNVSFSINPHERIGLVGANGSGKSTLFALLSGEAPSDSGSIWRAPDFSVGFLRQGFADQPNATFGDLLDQTSGGIISASKLMDDAIAQLSESSDSESLERYDSALGAFESIGGYQQAAELDSLLGKLKIDHLDRNAPLNQLSGGEKTRIGLAGLLAQKPGLLLLDEPTNHLDAAALAWLESFVFSYPGAIMVVSHDRAFLDNVVNQIFELDAKTRHLTSYPGSYTDYLHAKQAIRVEQSNAFQRQQTEFARIKKDIRAVASHAMATETSTQNDFLRSRSKKVARTAVVRERKLEKLLASDEIVEKPERDWDMALDLDTMATAARDVVTLGGVSISLGGRPILRQLDLLVRSGERVALTGPNGSGKSTLLRVINGDLVPESGVVRIGAGIHIGIHAQEQETVDLKRSAVAQARAISNSSETDVRTFLHKFLFSGDLALAPAGELSYGERSRLALALLVIRGANLLLLDEPLNHLDLTSREQFEFAMQRYEGTALMVLHDRRAIERMATRVISIDDGRLVEGDQDQAGLRPPKTASSKYLK